MCSAYMTLGFNACTLGYGQIWSEQPPFQAKTEAMRAFYLDDELVALDREAREVHLPGVCTLKHIVNTSPSHHVCPIRTTLSACDDTGTWHGAGGILSWRPQPLVSVLGCA